MSSFPNHPPTDDDAPEEQDDTLVPDSQETSANADVVPEPAAPQANTTSGVSRSASTVIHVGSS